MTSSGVIVFVNNNVTTYRTENSPDSKCSESLILLILTTVLEDKALLI